MRSVSPPHFDVQRRLGLGGMADVHLAKMAFEGGTEWVALKRIRADARHDPELVTLFRREAKLCSLLQHPNIVPVRTWGVDEEGCYLALRYIDGPSAGRLLKSLARAGRQLSLTAALWILRDVAEALEYAHTFEFAALGIRGVIHRDVSADNLLISTDGVTVLTDFGIAKMIGGTRLTRPGTLKGKYGYMAPELFRGEEVTAAVDVFAFCVLAYELLTGVRPFSGTTEAEVLHAVLQVQPPSLTALRPDLPVAMAELIRAGLAKDPAERPKQMRAFCDLLETALGGASRETLGELTREVDWQTTSAPEEPSEALRVPRTVTHAPETPLPQRPRRRGRAVTAIATACVVFVVSGVAGWVSWRNPSSERTATVTARSVIEPGAGSADVTGPDVAATAELAPAVPLAKTLPVSAPASASTHTRPHSAAASTNPTPVSSAVRPKPVTRKRAATRQTRSGTSRVRPKPVDPSAPGTLRILVHPWAQVFVDGKLVGATPLPALSLKPGRHSLILVNETLDVREVHHVDIRAGQQHDVKYTLRRP